MQPMAQLHKKIGYRPRRGKKRDNGQYTGHWSNLALVQFPSVNFPSRAA